MRLVAAVVVSAVIGLLAALWGSEASAGVLGAAVAAVVSVVALGAQSEWQRQAEAARRRPEALQIASLGGRFPLVRDLRDPIAVGVHPAETTEREGRLDRVPAYVTRDIEPHLHAALRRGGFVLLVGESTAGKTRAAFEAIRLLHPDQHFVAPSTREAIAVLLDDWDATNGCVVWLDDLERFLGPGGLTTSTLHRLLISDRQVLVLATMRSHEYDRYRDRAEIEASGPAQEIWRQGRAVLRQAQVVHVERRWTNTERERARALTTDPRLVRALAGDQRFGVAELLAAGPELVEGWQHAWVPGHHPRGAALVAAAVDARRAGYHGPLPAEVLQQLHEGYLVRRGGTELRPESFRDALTWALTPTVPAGANSLLLGNIEHGLLAFDYLIDLPAHDAIPEPVWVAVMDLASPHEAYTIACNVYLSGNFPLALPALRRAAEAGIGQAEAILWESDAPMRSAEDGLAVAKQRTRALRQEFGADHEETLMAESMVASFTLHCGRHSEARILYERLTGRAVSILGDNHRVALGLEFGLASSTFASGAHDEGLALLETAVQKSISTLGPGDLAVLDRRRWVVQLLMEAGRDGDALERLTALETDCTHLSAMHPITVSVRRMASQLHHHQP
ncbi:hypothetical protein [Streptomyces sp. NBC_01443]|uniref:hypothetical protein n=1 Tax=Streptomyces sp. NBC_01443 TaxID=2903868 RepID=UPI002258AC3A|nr:hypothetical protein [Streptomyces sp. NBC_01443]MCX4626600.1 hypothetical protein [Streptomyces sp. NBC_01443]